MAVFAHICDLMFLDEKSFRYDPYYEVSHSSLLFMNRTGLDIQNLIIDLHYKNI